MSKQRGMERRLLSGRNRREEKKRYNGDNPES